MLESPEGHISAPCNAQRRPQTLANGRSDDLHQRNQSDTGTNARGTATGQHASFSDDRLCSTHS